MTKNRASSEKPDHLVLVGFMGAGKTTVGRVLAALTGREFVDLDQSIEEKAKTSIKNIFAVQGEEYFRALESEALEAMLKRTNCVVATGGGIVGRAKNWKVMRRLGAVIYLENDWETIVSRIADCPDRPLVTGKDLENVRALFAQRQPLYEQADLRVAVKNQEPSEVALTIVEMLSGETHRA